MNRMLRTRKHGNVIPKKLGELIEEGKRSADFAEGFDAASEIIAVGKLIRHLRAKAGMTQGQLAEGAGMTQTEISRIEAGLGKQGPTYMTLRKLSGALHADLFVQISKESRKAWPDHSANSLAAR